jgi:hypothetical protein
MAFARERDLLASLGIRKAEQVRIAAPEELASYTVTVKQHIVAIDDAEILLHASVLLHSYALAESAAADRLGKDPRLFGGIEDWGAQLLSAERRDWTAVVGGLATAVETAVTRNAFAHGSRTLDDGARARLLAAGAQIPPVGSSVTLTYTELRNFRECLRSLLEAGGL